MTEKGTNAHSFTFVAIDGGVLPLERFRGGPLLVVNTASECGYTPQYAGLQALWARYRDRGLAVVGVPSNDFGEQEPGEEATIQGFCTTRFGVDFPMTQKQRVIGPDAHPLYRWLADMLGEDAAPRWNFHKYLFDATGEPAGLWPSSVPPDDPVIVEAVESLLRS